MVKTEFLKLVNKYLEGRASIEEERMLLNFFESFQSSEEWDTQVLGVKQELEDKMLHRLTAKVESLREKEKVRAIYTGNWRKVAATIALLLITAGGLYYWTFKEKNLLAYTSKDSRFKNDIAPGGNRAILTLADGSTIVLDSANVGMLAEQASTAINKKSNGELIYEGHAPSAKDTKVIYNTISTPQGGQYKLTLSDGTKVWLNAESSLKFPAAFTGPERNVELKGEAYFEVARGRKPFHVNAGNNQIEVLGTHFNVMAYKGENYEATLLEGSVKVYNGLLSSDKKTNSTLLSPGQQARITHLDPLQINVIKNVDVEQVVGWKDGLFLFYNTPIDKVMNQLARWYNMEIEYDGSRPQIELTGEISRSTNLIRLLSILENTGGVKFGIEGRKIIVQKNN